jgi:hypothetical protein
VALDHEVFSQGMRPPGSPRSAIEALHKSARTRALGSLALCFLLLLVVWPAGLAAQDSASRLFPASADSDWPAATEATALPSTYRLLPQPSLVFEPFAAMDFGTESPALTPAVASAPWFFEAAPGAPPYLASLAADAAYQREQPEAEVPRSAFLERHRLLLSILVPITTLGAVTADALLPYGRDGFHIDHEGWFGRNTDNGGADKASHLADYFVVAGLFEDIYRMMGYPEKEAILWGFGLAVATGLAVEVNNGFTEEYGFSWEDLTMNVAGATAASLVSLTRTRDLFGMRTSHLPGSTYNHDVYSADFKLSGLGQRLGINIGPLRWLLVSVTYGVKGYRGSPTIEPQRQVGFEVGLNLQQILNDLGVRRHTWWGYSLHLLGDNIRFPFTAVGMRLDLNRGKWHGPNSGNYD